MNMNMSIDTPRIKQNLDTNFLKLIVIISMTVDHVGKVFFPDNIIMAVIGRIAFPLFAYCLVVGCLYTSNRAQYILRLSIFAVITQPIYALAMMSPEEEFFEKLIFFPNIMFTLVAGVLLVTALMNIKKNWWMLIIPLVVEIFIGFDYGAYAFILMVIFYLCRNNSILSFVLTLVYMGLQLPGDFMYIFGFGIDLQFFAILALPLIYIHTNTKLKLNKYIFYVFYPLHLLIITIVKIMLKV